MSKVKLLLRGSVLQALESIVAIAVGFITLPLMLKHLGADLYGVWVLVGGFTTLLYIFDLGFASSVTRSVASTIAVKNYEKTNSIVNSALVIYSGLALVILLVVGAIAMFYQPDVIRQVMSPGQFQWVIMIVGLSIAIEFPFKAFAGLTSAHLRYDLVAAYRIITKLLNTAALFYLLFNNYGLVAIAVLQLVTGIVSNLFFFFMAKNVYRELDVAPSYISRDIMKELFHFSSWAFLIDINRMLKERIDLFFIGGYVSLAAVSIYYVPVRLVEYTLQLLYKALNLSLPILTGNSSKGEPEKFRENLILFNRINVYFAVLTFFFFLLYGKTILYYWMGASFDSDSAYLILLVLMGARLSALSSNGFNNALYAQAKHKVIAYINFMEAIATAILLMLFLVVTNKGPLGAAAAIAIPLCLGRLVVLPWWALKILAVRDGASLVWQSYRPLVLLVLVCIAYALMPLNAQLSLAHVIYGFVCLLSVLVYAGMELQLREREYLRGFFKKVGGKFSNA